MIEKLLLSLWESARRDGIDKTLILVEGKKGARLLDCGCGNGELTMRVARMAGSNDVYGIDLDGEALREAEMKGIKAYHCDLNKRFPFESDFFDVVFAHQIIEHLYDIDNFVKEIRRVLKSGCCATVSTENLSSWHNIFALFLGYQDFSHHPSNQFYIGNPLSPHYMERLYKPLELHTKILTYQSLKEVFEIHGFKVEKIVGAGYYPFPRRLSSLLSSLDRRHAHFITIKARKMSS